MFELKLKEKSISLKWGTWAMREFCLMKNITLEEYFATLSESKLDLDLIVKLIYAGYKNACRINNQDVINDENDVCDWIDEMGGLFASDSQLVDYIKYIADSTTLNTKSNKKTDDKKKV